MCFSYVVFTKCDDERIGRFLHPEISHCFIIKQDRGNWIVYGKALKSFDLYTTKTYSDILEESYVIKVREKECNRGLFMLNTCVGHVKQYLGITNPFIWTPYQLFKYLRNSNG